MEPAAHALLLHILLLLLASLSPINAQEDGIDLYSLNVDSKVTMRFAHTTITSRVVNKAKEAHEAIFQVELPRRAFITNFSMIIDGVTYPGEIKEKAAAQEKYSSAVARGQSAGIIRATGRNLEKFQVSVNVAPTAKATFELVYEELLKRQLGKYELMLKVRPQQLVKHLQIDVHIFEPQGISSLETESTFMTKNLADALTTTQNETKAHIVFRPSLAQQQKEPGTLDTILDGNFIVRYDVNRPTAAGDIQIENGYFVHHFAPAELSTLPKNVVFVIDKSGSMSGRKIKQTQEALVKILSDLKPGDQFNLVTFSGHVTQWKPALLQALNEHVEEAKKFAHSIQAHGSTNINEAVLVAVRMLDESNRKEQLPAGSVSMVILLTDGDPTEGEKDPQKIQENVKAAIEGQYYLYCLGFGFDVNYAFLEKLALENGGVARRIYEDSDADLQLQDFYQEVANPLLTMVKFQYPENTVEQLTQDNFRVFFKGSEIVVAGKLPPQLKDLLSAQVSAQSHAQNFTFQTEVNVADKEKVFQSPKYIFHNFMERLWAYLTIQQLLEKAVSASGDEQKSLEARALDLSLKFSFVTPLTSMVVTKPEGQDQTQVVSKPLEADNDMSSSFSLLAKSHNTAFSHSPRTPKREGFLRIRRPSGSPGIPDLLPGPPGRFFLSGAPTFDMHTDYDDDASSRGLDSLLSSNFRPPMELYEVSTPFPTLPVERAPHFILLRNNRPEETMCVNVKGSPLTPQSLFSDPVQGIEVTGKYEGRTDKFMWLEVSYRTPEVKVHVTQDSIVITRGSGGKSSSYQWPGTLYLVMPGLKVNLENGSLLLSDSDKVTIGLISLGHPSPGLRLFLNDPGHFSSQVSGVLGQFYQDLQWDPAGPSTIGGQRELSGTSSVGSLCLNTELTTQGRGGTFGQKARDRFSRKQWYCTTANVSMLVFGAALIRQSCPNNVPQKATCTPSSRHPTTRHVGANRALSRVQGKGVCVKRSLCLWGTLDAMLAFPNPAESSPTALRSMPCRPLQPSRVGLHISKLLPLRGHVHPLRHLVTAAVSLTLMALSFNNYN
ncbi:inter-alpha-trypsin inhibitor heavy chain H4-like [Petaurus breviceps papuanus]|uniref:inter-alpha-trypsin inhibitor heavy chain H4-like n=1 Tax=Petaurus breviceps papuanus TaxID=3040969 RepID=UPI0036DE056E